MPHTAEFMAGPNPLDPNSRLAVTAATVGTGGLVEVNDPSVSGVSPWF
jgi:hypothetical protein